MRIRRYTVSQVVQLTGLSSTTVRALGDRMRLGRRNAANQREFSQVDVSRLLMYRKENAVYFRQALGL